ncbi:MAG: hypothetical protein NTX59_07680 [Elusimicrobia bacterium]|nr:hypothetical protein [Elusimicrobiota bacterium]
MKTIMPLILALVLAPTFLMAAQRDAAPAKKAGFNDAAGSFLQLQNWAPAAQDFTAIPAPTAVPAEEDQPWANGLDKGLGLKASYPSGSMCCTSSEECGRTKSEGFSVLGVRSADLPNLQSALLAFRTITQSRWYLTFPDGRALTDGSVGSLFITRKSLIGAYKFDVKTMSVDVTWNADPSVNLPKAGVFKQKISQICFAPDRVMVASGLVKLEIGAQPRSTLIQPSPNSGTDTPVVRQGYMLFTDYGQYLASSDGK